MTAKKTADTAAPTANIADWVFRGGSFAALLAVLAWLGVNLMNGQTALGKNMADMRVEFQQKLSDWRGDFQTQFASTNNGVTKLSSDVGQNTGNLQMTNTRVDRQGQSLNELRDRVTRIEALQGGGK